MSPYTHADQHYRFTPTSSTGTMRTHTIELTRGMRYMSSLDRADSSDEEQEFTRLS